MRPNNQSTPESFRFPMLAPGQISDALAYLGEREPPQDERATQERTLNDPALQLFFLGYYIDPTFNPTPYSGSRPSDALAYKKSLIEARKQYYLTLQQEDSPKAARLKLACAKLLPLTLLTGAPIMRVLTESPEESTESPTKYFDTEKAPLADTAAFLAEHATPVKTFTQQFSAKGFTLKLDEKQSHIRSKPSSSKGHNYINVDQQLTFFLSKNDEDYGAIALRISGVARLTSDNDAPLAKLDTAEMDKLRCPQLNCTINIASDNPVHSEAISRIISGIDVTHTVPQHNTPSEALAAELPPVASAAPTETHSRPTETHSRPTECSNQSNTRPLTQTGHVSSISHVKDYDKGIRAYLKEHHIEPLATTSIVEQLPSLLAKAPHNKHRQNVLAALYMLSYTDLAVKNPAKLRHFQAAENTVIQTISSIKKRLGAFKGYNSSLLKKLTLAQSRRLHTLNILDYTAEEDKARDHAHLCLDHSGYRVYSKRSGRNRLPYTQDEQTHLLQQYTQVARNYLGKHNIYITLPLTQLQINAAFSSIKNKTSHVSILAALEILAIAQIGLHSGTASDADAAFYAIKKYVRADDCPIKSFSLLKNFSDIAIGKYSSRQSFSPAALSSITQTIEHIENAYHPDRKIPLVMAKLQGIIRLSTFCMDKPAKPNALSAAQKENINAALNNIANYNAINPAQKMLKKMLLALQKRLHTTTDEETYQAIATLAYDVLKDAVQREPCSILGDILKYWTAPQNNEARISPYLAQQIASQLETALNARQLPKSQRSENNTCPPILSYISDLKSSNTPDNISMGSLCLTPIEGATYSLLHLLSQTDDQTLKENMGLLLRAYKRSSGLFSSYNNTPETTPLEHCTQLIQSARRNPKAACELLKRTLCKNTNNTCLVYGSLAALGVSLVTYNQGKSPTYQHKTINTHAIAINNTSYNTEVLGRYTEGITISHSIEDTPPTREAATMEGVINAERINFQDALRQAEPTHAPGSCAASSSDSDASNQSSADSGPAWTHAADQRATTADRKTTAASSESKVSEKGAAAIAAANPDNNATPRPG